MTKPLGLLMAAFDISACPEDEFNDWYDTEHIPDREKVPGFLTLERWVDVANPKVALAIYDLQSVDVLQSPQYLPIGYRNPSPWTRRLMPMCQRVLRFAGEQITPGNVISPRDCGGLLFMGFNLEPGAEDDYARWMDEEHLPNLSKVPGVLSARRFIATEGTSKYIAVYHLTSPEVCASPEWLAARETPWTHQIRPRTRERLRLTCRPYRRARPIP
ncbi:MAG: hypothetical protein GEV05_29445 [Betaproteobacteria bacterium]|nr:hypothetical protein [Betaproteobacteria bacterium]